MIVEASRPIEQPCCKYRAALVLNSVALFFTYLLYLIMENVSFQLIVPNKCYKWTFNKIYGA